MGPPQRAQEEALGPPLEWRAGMIRPRPPAFSQGFVSFLWAVGLGAFIWVGLVAIGVSNGTGFLFGLIGGALIFFYVRLYGGEQYRR